MGNNEDKELLAIRAMRDYLNDKAEYTSLSEYVTWIISLLGKDHLVSKVIEPLVYITDLNNQKKQVYKAFYDLVSDRS